MNQLAVTYPDGLNLSYDYSFDDDREDSVLAEVMEGRFQSSSREEGDAAIGRPQHVRVN